MSYQPRITLLDIENSMARGYFFGKVYETNINHVEEQSYILSVAYSHYPSKKVHVLALCDYKGYKGGADCEERLLQDVWKLLDESDVVVAQKGDTFDIKHLNSRFAYYRMTPPSPYQTVDTLKQLKKAFNLPSNKLDFVCNYFGIGGKLPNTGKDLWLGCMGGDLKDWKMMKKYNAHDIVLLDKLYTLLLPWGRHPNLNTFTGRSACPKCNSLSLQSRGRVKMASGRVYTKMYCPNCGGWSRDLGEMETKIAIRPI